MLNDPEVPIAVVVRRHKCMDKDNEAHASSMLRRTRNNAKGSYNNGCRHPRLIRTCFLVDSKGTSKKYFTQDLTLKQTHKRS